jgi:hypothetical protein
MLPCKLPGVLVLHKMCTNIALLQARPDQASHAQKQQPKQLSENRSASTQVPGLYTARIPSTLNAARKGPQLAISKADTLMSFLIALTHIYLYYTLLLLPGTRLHLRAQVELLLLWVLRRLHAA